MSNTLIVYGSTTGNTETVAEQISSILQKKGNGVTIKNVGDTAIDELGKHYDLIIFGSSTWGDDNIEFQEDFEPFYKELDKAELKDKRVALFGCGDSSYEHFCGAVDLLEEKMEELGAKIIETSLRIDGDPDDSVNDITDWSFAIAEML